MKIMWIVQALWLTGLLGFNPQSRAEQVELKVAVNHPVVLAGFIEGQARDLGCLFVLPRSGIFEKIRLFLV